MAEAEEGSSVADVYASLRALARDEGARRPDEALLDFLRGEGSALCRALRIDIANGPISARNTILGYLLGSIDQLKVRPARQELEVEQRDDQYKYAVIVCFNVSGQGAVSGTLTERRNWLNNSARGTRKIAQSVCQDDFDHACKQIAERLAGVDSRAGQATADAVDDTGPEASTAKATGVNLKRPVSESVSNGKARRPMRVLLKLKSVRIVLALVLVGGVVAVASSYLYSDDNLNQGIGSAPGFVDGKPVPAKCQPTLSALNPGQGNALYVTLTVKTDDSPCWTPIVAPVAFGTMLRYMISYQNNSGEDQKNVVAGVRLAANLSLIPNSTYLFNSNNPNGVQYNSNKIASGGIVVGSYAPGAGAYIVFSAAFPFGSDLKCGTTDIRSLGVIRPENMSEYYNTASTQTFKRC